MTTYLSGRSLSEAQLATLASENVSSGTLDQLLNAMNTSFDGFEQSARAIDPTTFSDARFVGRKRLPTTVIGLIVHIAEHAQRHVGQAITTCKLVMNDHR